MNFGQHADKEFKPLIRMVEPVLLNPNSYSNIEKILEQMKVFAKVGVEREWVFLGCDGPPCCLAERIIHKEKEKFNFVSMVPGLGHYHMNQQKTVFKILDEIVLESLGKDVLNLQSPKAYQFLVAAKDTHKTWQAIQVLLFGTSGELIRVFKSEIYPNQGSVLEFLQWIADNPNATIKMIGNVLFSYVLSVYFFKIGVRLNDTPLIDAA